jgi:hypothetical protein
LQEAAWHGAPVILAPLVVDQKANAATAVEAGIGVEIALHEATTNLIKQLISQVINNNRYGKWKNNFFVKQKIMCMKITHNPMSKTILRLNHISNERTSKADYFFTHNLDNYTIRYE